MQPDFQADPDAVDAVRTTSLVKDFGGKIAVDGLSLRVTRGTFFGFLGPNGAGKSTTIKMLTGLLAPTHGSIEILGLDFASRAVEVKRQIGVVPEDLALFDRLTGSEYLEFVGGMYGLSRAVAVDRAERLLAFMKLDDEPKKLIVDYSHGMKKKVSLAAALIHSPKVLFLDEPFEGVDAIAAKTMKGVLNTMIGRGATIFLTSHVLDIVERLCTHVAIIDKGRLVAQGSVEELRAGVSLDGDGSRRTLTLEEIFVAIVGGGSEEAERALSWLAE
jgi:ABC-2 type transport system ATP-binding protein